MLEDNRVIFRRRRRDTRPFLSLRSFAYCHVFYFGVTPSCRWAEAGRQPEMGHGLLRMLDGKDQVLSIEYYTGLQV
jgi:hypothetical protein